MRVFSFTNNRRANKMNEKSQAKWTGPDEINGVLHVGKGYRQAGMNMADRLRADREQWYPGDSESGENGIWAHARPGSFDPLRIYRVQVERKDEQDQCAAKEGYRVAGASDRFRNDREKFVPGPDGGWGGWVRALSGECDSRAEYRVPIERKGEPGVYGDSDGEAVPPLVGEFEDGGREGGPDYRPGECDAVEPDSTNGREDMVNRPPHYTQGGIECIDAIRSALTPEEFRGFCKGNSIQYIWRERYKGGDEDLSKTTRYLNWAIDEAGVTQ